MEGLCFLFVFISASLQPVVCSHASAGPPAPLLSGWPLLFTSSEGFGCFLVEDGVKGFTESAGDSDHQENSPFRGLLSWKTFMKLF